MDKNRLEELHKFYLEVDKKVKQNEELNSDRINCKKGCSSCCIDDITVFNIEAYNIQQNYSGLLQNGRANSEGECAFLNSDKNCRIYEHRPYVCRTQGLPLSWIEELEDGNLAEMRDICPLNDVSDPIEEIESENCWVIGPFESNLYLLQEKAFGNLERIKLRDLFGK